MCAYRRLKFIQYRTGVWKLLQKPQCWIKFLDPWEQDFIQYWAGFGTLIERAQFFPLPALDKNRSPSLGKSKEIWGKGLALRFLDFPGAVGAFWKSDADSLKIRDLKITSASTEGQKRSQNVAPVLVIISGKTLWYFLGKWLPVLVFTSAAPLALHTFHTFIWITNSLFSTPLHDDPPTHRVPKSPQQQKRYSQNPKIFGNPLE